MISSTAVYIILYVYQYRLITIHSAENDRHQLPESQADTGSHDLACRDLPTSLGTRILCSIASDPPVLFWSVDS